MTQATFSLNDKGLHGSMYFTLSLPVSRFRLFATRAGLGMLEAAGVLAALLPAQYGLCFPLPRMTSRARICLPIG